MMGIAQEATSAAASTIVATNNNNNNRRSQKRMHGNGMDRRFASYVNSSNNNSSSSVGSSYDSNASASAMSTGHVTMTAASSQSGNGNGGGRYADGGNRYGNRNNKVDYKHSFSANGKCTSPLEVELRKFGIYTTKPIISHMVTLQARLASFERWPKLKTPTSEELAEAGFYFTGEFDRTRCFYCGLALHNWLPEDDAWTEHETHSEPDGGCDYIRMCRNMVGGADGSVAGAKGAPAGNSAKYAEKKMIEENRDVIREFFESIDEKGTLDDLETKMPAWRGEEHVRFALEAGYSRDIISKALITNNCIMFPSALDLIDRIDALRIITENQSPDEATGVDGANAEAQINKNSNRDSKLCKICMDAEISLVLLPCAHLVCCPRCSLALRNCPMCRCESTGRLRIFM